MLQLSPSTATTATFDHHYSSPESQPPRRAHAGKHRHHYYTVGVCEPTAATMELHCVVFFVHHVTITMTTPLALWLQFVGATPNHRQHLHQRATSSRVKPTPTQPESTIAAPLTTCNNHTTPLQLAFSCRATTIASARSHRRWAMLDTITTRRRSKISHLHASLSLHRFAPVLTRLNHHNAVRREPRRKCIQSHCQPLVAARSATIATTVNHGRNTWGNPNFGERKRTTTCPLLNGKLKSQNWPTSQL